MPRQKNDGRGRLGGRTKGTPNKVTSSIRDWLMELVNKNKRQVKRDLDALDPKDRLVMIEKFMQYVVPKQQAVAASVDFSTLTDEQLDMVVEQITTGIIDDEGTTE